MTDSDPLPPRTVLRPIVYNPGAPANKRRAGKFMRGPRLRCRRRLIAILPTLAGIGGCASMRHADMALSPEYYGVWAAHGTATQSWWEIRADQVVNFQVSVDGQACEGRAVTVVTADALDIGTRIRLYMVGDQLVFAAPAVRTAYSRASVQDICRRPDGTYLENAPYVVKKLKGRVA
jgi:hypothetical protein